MEGSKFVLANDSDLQNGSVREPQKNPLNSGLGIVVIFPDLFFWVIVDRILIFIPS